MYGSNAAAEENDESNDQFTEEGAVAGGSDLLIVLRGVPYRSAPKTDTVRCWFQRMWKDIRAKHTHDEFFGRDLRKVDSAARCHGKRDDDLSTEILEKHGRDVCISV